MQTSPHSHLVLQTTTPSALHTLLPALGEQLRAAGVWLSDTRAISATSADLDLELPAYAAAPLYTALVRSGLRLSKAAHVALASLCFRPAPGLSGTRDLRLEIRCLAAPPTARSYDVISA